MRVTTLDCETFPITPGVLAPDLVCVQVAEGDGDVEIILANDPRLPARLEAALASDVLLGHNVAYDLAVIGNEFPDLWPAIWQAYDSGRVTDTMMVASLLDIARGQYRPGQYSLKVLATTYAGKVLEKGDNSWQLRYHELHGMPVESWPVGAVEYARTDVEATREVWKVLTESGRRNPPTLDVQVRAAWALHLCSCWGMRCDPAAVDALEHRIQEHKAALLPQLQAVGFLRADLTRDDKRVREYAEQAGVTKRTAAGKVSVSVDALQDVDDANLKALADYLGWLKLESTYLPVVREGTTSPVQARYGIVESGRTSCSRPNLQNLPRKGSVRECFASRPGYVYVAADYSIVELVCLSQVLLRWIAPTSAMARALLEDRDLHLVTAAMILGTDYDTVRDRYKSGDKGAAEARQLAKALSFGIPGGLGAHKLSKYLGNYGISVSETEAHALKTRWLRLFPEMRLYFDRVGAEAQSSRTFAHPITGFLRGDLDYCSLANHLFQHLAAYGAKVAMHAIQRACWADEASPLYGSRLVAFIHDEFLLEVPENRVHEAAQELSLLMRGEFLVACPDVPVKVEVVAMRRWCKAAKPCYDQAGRLIPWEG